MNALPNFLHIGTSKAGSTWIFKMLSSHPDIFMAAGKGLYFFCGHYDRGLAWYSAQFTPTRQQRLVGESSHTYMASAAACKRIANDLPQAKLIACVREPAERAFSDYLDGIKNGGFTGSFEEVLEHEPEIVDIGRYGSQIQRYLDYFPRQQLHVAPFDDLVSRPAEFAAKIQSFLGIEPGELSTSLQQNKVMPAGTPRSKPLARMTKRLSKAAKRAGFKRLIGRAKTSVTLRNLLYRQYTPETRPKMRPETRLRLRELFAPEVEQMDRLLATDFGRAWRYVEEDSRCPV